VTNEGVPRRVLVTSGRRNVVSPRKDLEGELKRLALDIIQFTNFKHNSVIPIRLSISQQNGCAVSLQPNQMKSAWRNWANRGVENVTVKNTGWEMRDLSVIKDDA